MSTRAAGSLSRGEEAQCSESPGALQGRAHTPLQDSSRAPQVYNVAGGSWPCRLNPVPGWCGLPDTPSLGKQAVWLLGLELVQSILQDLLAL